MYARSGILCLIISTYLKGHVQFPQVLSFRFLVCAYKNSILYLWFSWFQTGYPPDYSPWTLPALNIAWDNSTVGQHAIQFCTLASSSLSSPGIMKLWVLPSGNYLLVTLKMSCPTMILLDLITLATRIDIRFTERQYKSKWTCKMPHLVPTLQKTLLPGIT